MNNKNIILVEDCREDAEVILRIFSKIEKSQFKVKHIDSYEDAIEYINNHVCDLVLLDLNLPDSPGGIDTLKEIQEEIEEIPIIVLTGLNDDSIGNEAIKFGAQDFLLKNRLDEWMLEKSIIYAIDRHNQTYELKLHHRELQLFSKIVRHDLREPTRVLLPLIDGFIKKYIDVEDEGAKKYLKLITQSSNKLEEIIKDLYIYCGISIRPVEVEEIDFKLLVDRVLKNKASLINELSAEIEVDVVAKIYGDNLQIECLLQALLDNALKYCKKTVRPNIKLKSSLSSDEQKVFITVSDNGLGIDKKYLSKIFTVFQSLHDDSSELHRNGMGLGICRIVCEKHGGGISVDSSLGEGSTFKIELMNNKRDVIDG